MDESTENVLVVNFPVSLRAAPDEESAEIESLKTGTYLVDLQELSNFISSVYLDDSLYKEPWIRVQTAGKKQGWVFAGALRLPNSNAQTQHEWLLAKRFEACFGKQLTRDWHAWKLQTPVNNDAAFAKILLEGLRLRDTLNQLIAYHVTRDPNQSPPDFFWLGPYSPFFIIQQIGDGTGYYLFLDYRQIVRQAAQTTGRQDDLFAQAGVAAFPLDSIESPFPIWVFPLSTEESASNLGAGHHLHCLQAIDKAWQSGPDFHPELRRMTEALLADVLDVSRKYWQPREKILAELEKIRTTKLICLNDRDRLALEERFKMFEWPNANELHVNLRAGK